VEAVTREDVGVILMEKSVDGAAPKVTVSVFDVQMHVDGGAEINIVDNRTATRILADMSYEAKKIAEPILVRGCTVAATAVRSLYAIQVPRVIIPVVDYPSLQASSATLERVRFEVVPDGSLTSEAYLSRAALRRAADDLVIDTKRVCVLRLGSSLGGPVSEVGAAESVEMALANPTPAEDEGGGNDPATIFVDLTVEQQARLNNMQQQFQPCFIPHSMGEFAAFAPYRVRLKQTDGQSILRGKLMGAHMRRIPPHLLPHVVTAARSWLASGRVELHDSDTFDNPVVCVEQRGKFRTCLDFREVNSETLEEPNAVPFFEDQLNQPACRRVKTKLDAKGAYQQMVLSTESRDLTSFFVPGVGRMRFLGTPFGLNGAPSAFQRRMEGIIGPDLLQHSVWVYIDDIIIATDSIDEHFSVLGQVLELLRRSNVRLNEKVIWVAESLEFLGFQLRPGAISVPRHRLQAFAEMEPPKSYKQLESYLGLIEWFGRKLLPRMSELEEPFRMALREWKRSPRTCHPWEWTPALQLAFDRVRADMMQAELRTPRWDWPWIMRPDASEHFAACVLLMIATDGAEVPIAFMSHRFPVVQSNWPVIEKECFAIVLGFRKWRYWLLTKAVTVFTDHLNLIYMVSSENRKVRRWFSELLEYQFSVRHIPGTENVIADALSRVGSEVGDTFASARCPNVRLLVVHDVQEIATNSSFVPDESERERICTEAHLAGHMGVARTLNRIQRHFRWPGMRDLVKKVVKRCEICRRYQKGSGEPLAPLHVIPTSGVNDVVHLDFIGPLPESADKLKYILLAVDRFSRVVKLTPTPDATAESALKGLLRYCFSYGYPSKMITDGGSHFTSQLMAKIVQLMKIKHHVTVPYHPESNGMAERHIQDVIGVVRKLCHQVRNEWPNVLEECEFQVNTAVCRATGYTPFDVMFGHQVRDAVALLASTLSSRSRVDAAMVSDTSTSSNFASDIAEFVKAKGACLVAVHDAVKSVEGTLRTYQNRSRAPAVTEFEVGSIVLLSTIRRSAKMDPFWTGPYFVLEKISPLVYVLGSYLDAAWRLRVHVNRIRAYDGTRVGTAQLRSEAAASVGQYFVDVIRAVDTRKKRALVHWEGYDTEHDTWEPLENVSSTDAYQRFLQGGSVVETN
jgi:hypothetical protein